MAAATLVVYFATLVFVPKMNLFYISASYVGAKPDDIAFLILVVGAILVAARRRAIFGVSGVFFVAALSLVGIAALAGPAETGFDRAIYAARYAAYFATFAGAYLLARAAPWGVVAWLRRIAVVGLLTHLVVIVLQRASIMGGVWDGLWRADVSYRPTGLAAHPTESAAVLIVLYTMAVVPLGTRRLRPWFNVALGLAVIAAMMVTGTRSSLFAFAIANLVILILRRRFRLSKLLQALVVSLIMIPVLPILASTDSSGRIAGLFDIANAQALASFLSHGVGYPEIVQPLGVDRSLDMRLTKWAGALEHFEVQPMIGRGAAIVGESVDGFYVRLLAETGVVGLTLFLIVVFSSSVRVIRCPSLRAPAAILIISFLLIAVTIDIFYFARAAFSFWFVLGVLTGVARKGTISVSDRVEHVAHASVDRSDERTSLQPYSRSSALRFEVARMVCQPEIEDRAVRSQARKASGAVIVRPAEAIRARAAAKSAPS